MLDEAPTTHELDAATAKHGSESDSAAATTGAEQQPPQQQQQQQQDDDAVAAAGSMIDSASETTDVPRSMDDEDAVQVRRARTLPRNGKPAADGKKD